MPHPHPHRYPHCHPLPPLVPPPLPPSLLPSLPPPLPPPPPPPLLPPLPPQFPHPHSKTPPPLPPPAASRPVSAPPARPSTASARHPKASPTKGAAHRPASPVGDAAVATKRSTAAVRGFVDRGGFLAAFQRPSKRLLDLSGEGLLSGDRIWWGDWACLVGVVFGWCWLWVARLRKCRMSTDHQNLQQVQCGGNTSKTSKLRCI